MNLPLRIKFVGLRPSEPLREAVRAEAAQLDRFRAALGDCEVSLESWCLHHREGTQYRVAIEAEVAAQPLAVSRSSRLDAPRDELLTTLRAAFEALGRRLAALRPDLSAQPGADARPLH